MKANPRDIILYPIYTEKTVEIGEDGRRVTFAVAKHANKTQVKQAIEEIFNVKVIAVNTMHVKENTQEQNKALRKPSSVWSKATLLKFYKHRTKTIGRTRYFRIIA